MTATKYKKYFFDMDGVVTDTNKRIVEMYNEDFGENVNYEDGVSWNFPECPRMTEEKLYEYFESPRLFEKLEMIPGFMKWYLPLDCRIECYIVTLGTAKNLELKKRWVNRHIPRMKFIGVDCAVYDNKDHIDMSGGIFFDDHPKNLVNSNADRKICFGPITEWNKDWTGERLLEW